MKDIIFRSERYPCTPITDDGIDGFLRWLEEFGVAGWVLHSHIIDGKNGSSRLRVVYRKTAELSQEEMREKYSAERCTNHRWTTEPDIGTMSESPYCDSCGIRLCDTDPSASWPPGEMG